MVSDEPDELLSLFEEWVQHEPSITAALLFGSRARAMVRADQWSDIDVQVVTRSPKQFKTREWVSSFYSKRIVAYVVRPASGGVIKATAIFDSGGEIDVVVVPAFKLRVARLVVSLGIHRRVPWVSRSLNELATVMRAGHRVIKGGRKWQDFYAKVIREVHGTRLSDEEAMILAEEFVCDYLWITKKLQRGECIAAQRMLHRSLAETNFRLLHETRLRRGDVSFREARRLEQLLTGEEIRLIRIEAEPERNSIHAAATVASEGLRNLMLELVGNRWSWPLLKANE